MSQYRARKKALNQKRDQMMDLFVDSRIKLANKPTTYGEFYDYVIDLDRPKPKAKRLSAKATPQVKPVVPAEVVKRVNPPIEQTSPESKSTPKPTQSDNQSINQSTNTGQSTKDKGGIWDSYTK